MNGIAHCEMPLPLYQVAALERRKDENPSENHSCFQSHPDLGFSLIAEKD